MPRDAGLPPGTLVMLILRVLANQPLHGYAIAQRIHQLSNEELTVEEGSLYPALQKLLIKGWVKGEWVTSDTGRQVREYRITPNGKKQLAIELAEYRRMATAIDTLLDAIS
jgi:PadR family transcriptional regulator PadR